MMNNNSTLSLSKQESQILHDICFIRMKVLKSFDVVFDSASSEQIPIHEEITITSARMAILVFDFFHSAFSGNLEAVKRQAAIQKSMSPLSSYLPSSEESYDGMIIDYQNLMNGLMSQYEYITEDVLQLHSKIKDFIKSQNYIGG